METQTTTITINSNCEVEGVGPDGEFDLNEGGSVLFVNESLSNTVCISFEEDPFTSGENSYQVPPDNSLSLSVKSSLDDEEYNGGMYCSSTGCEAGFFTEETKDSPPIKPIKGTKTSS